MVKITKEMCIRDSPHPRSGLFLKPPFSAAVESPITKIVVVFVLDVISLSLIHIQMCIRDSSYRVQRFFCFKRSFRLYHLTNLKRNFLFLTFTFISYTVESSYYIHIFLATHIRDAIEIIISYCLECRNIIETVSYTHLRSRDFPPPLQGKSRTWKQKTSYLCTRKKKHEV